MQFSPFLEGVFVIGDQVFQSLEEFQAVRHDFSSFDNCSKRGAFEELRKVFLLALRKILELPG